MVPIIATNFPTDNAIAFVPLVGAPPDSVVPAAWNRDSSMMRSLSWTDSPTSMLLSQVGSRQILINTRNTIQQTFPGYIQNRQFQSLLNSYNQFNTATRGAAIDLANRYNQQARKQTLFDAMNGLVNAARAGNQSLCFNKMLATVNAINDLLANVGA
jgi:hypothetical protein